jgi:enoyl-[acyl-carrier protein] reductase II
VTPVHRIAFDNRVTRLLGVDVPIANAPMGYVASPDLVAAVANAGAIGLVPGSGGAERARRDLRRVRELTDRRVGVNIPVGSTRDPAIVEMLVDEGVELVTTSAGSASTLTRELKDAGLIVFHVVISLESAKRAVDAGVDGVIVEGVEGAGLKGRREVSTLVLLPLVAANVDVPVVVAGGIADGASMAAAFALGAEAVQMGTRMLASAESPVHHNLKKAVVEAAETDTLLVNRHNGRPLRVLRTATTEALEFATDGDPFSDLLPSMRDVYEAGDLNASLPSLGQVAGRVDAVLPVAEIIGRTVKEFREVVQGLADRYTSSIPRD